MNFIIFINDDILNAIRQIPDETIDIVVADYPFKIRGDKKDYVEFIRRTGDEFFRVLKDGGNLIIINNPANMFYTMEHFQQFLFRSMIPLKRKHRFCPNKMFCFRYNLLLYLCKGHKDNWNYVKEDDYWNIEYSTGYNGHPSGLSTKLTDRILYYVRRKGYTVLDAFAGSGSFLLSSVKYGMNYIGVEIEQKYYEILRNRIDGVPFGYIIYNNPQNIQKILIGKKS